MNGEKLITGIFTLNTFDDMRRKKNKNRIREERRGYDEEKNSMRECV